MPKVKLALTNVHTGGLDDLIFFEDGMIAIGTEKSWTLIGGDGAVVEHFWKEVPQSAYFQAYCDWDGKAIEVPGWDDNDTCSPFNSILFGISRKWRGLLPL